MPADPTPSRDTSTPAAVSVVGLVKRYGDRTVLDGVSLSASLAAVTAVLGPNGAGKTTTVEICEGFRRADSGSVRVLGLDPQEHRAELSARVGVMLQEGGVYGSVSASDALTHAASLYANPQPVAVLIDRMGLAPVSRLPYKRLSGGQQQRLGIALAVIGRPEVVFLDEPTAGLDPQSRHATWELIADLRQAGVGVVLTTHYIEEAEQLADHVVIVDEGSVVATGSPAELTAGAGGEVVRFTGAARLDLSALNSALNSALLTAVAVEESPGKYRVSGASAADLLAAVTGWCSTHSVMPTSMATDRRSLQDVFLEITGRKLRP
ncbi:MAG: ABC transporter ATP-binding protein [Candidatus Nanopelagicales bacterium]